MSSHPEVTLEHLAYGGWPNCIKLSNGLIEIVATTDVGPRLIHFGFVGERNLFRQTPEDMGKTGGSDFRAYGGHRFWHAPEIKPRTYAPDNSSITSHWTKGVLTLAQPTEPGTGMEKRIDVTLHKGSARVTVLHHLTNRNVWPIEAAPWALTVMQGPGRAIFPQEPASKELLPARPMVLWGYSDMGDSRWTWGSRYVQLCCDPAKPLANKFGIMNTLGWGAYVSGGCIFVKRFGFSTGATYPDFGCNAECYTAGDMLEVESLGPLRNLEPGETIEHREEWQLFRGEVPEAEEEIERVLLPLVRSTPGVD